MLENIVFMIMRRMRVPLLTLICTYAISILGLVLIPGSDGEGHPFSMSIFHAFYFVSYMATTIGFGEIPYEFTDGQRLWVLFTIYGTVIVWIYSIGTLLSLVQDPAFQQALTERRLFGRIKRLRDPFILICGYGDTGEALVASLLERGQHAVVVEPNEARINALRLQGLPEYVPALQGDARIPANLLKAGLGHEKCIAVCALSSNNQVNLKVAITSKLLWKEAQKRHKALISKYPGRERQDVKVLCRADSKEVEANMMSFGTDYIIDPYDIFAIHLATALEAPCLYLLHEWLTSISHSALRDPIYPPSTGLWVLCGFGRFGKVVYKRLRDEDIEVVVIEATPAKTGEPKEGCLVGWGTEADTLREAGIERAVGLVAGTDHDVNNLSIIMTAINLNPDLFVIARQNLQINQELFEAVNADIVMHPSWIVANRIRVQLATPLLYKFESLALYQDDDWACELISRISAFVQGEVPEVWEVTIDEESAFAVYSALNKGRRIELGSLLYDPRDCRKRLPCIPLLMVQRSEQILLPQENQPLHIGDQLLFCGGDYVKGRMEWSLNYEHSLNYVATSGTVISHGWLWSALFRRKGSR